MTAPNIFGSSVWTLMSPFFCLEFWGGSWLFRRFLHPLCWAVQQSLSGCLVQEELLCVTEYFFVVCTVWGCKSSNVYHNNSQWSPWNSFRFFLQSIESLNTWGQPAGSVAVYHISVSLAMGCSLLLLIFMCWTASVTDVSPLQCVVMYHTSCVLELPTPLQNALMLELLLWWRAFWTHIAHMQHVYSHFYKKSHTTSSLDFCCCGYLCPCIWFAASRTKLNSLHHQFVTFFSTLSLPRFVDNESAIMDEYLCDKIYFHHYTLCISFLVYDTLPLLCKESGHTVVQGFLTEYC